MSAAFPRMFGECDTFQSVTTAKRTWTLAKRVRGGQPAVDAMTVRLVLRSEKAVEAWLLLNNDNNVHDKPAEESAGKNANIAR
jgi:hypothetical protein